MKHLLTIALVLACASEAAALAPQCTYPACSPVDFCFKENGSENCESQFDLFADSRLSGDFNLSALAEESGTWTRVVTRVSIDAGFWVAPPGLSEPNLDLYLPLIRTNRTDLQSLGFDPDDIMPDSILSGTDFQAWVDSTKPSDNSVSERFQPLLWPGTFALPTKRTWTWDYDPFWNSSDRLWWAETRVHPINPTRISVDRLFERTLRSQLGDALAARFMDNVNGVYDRALDFNMQLETQLVTALDANLAPQNAIDPDPNDNIPPPGIVTSSWAAAGASNVVTFTILSTSPDRFNELNGSSISVSPGDLIIFEMVGLRGTAPTAFLKIDNSPGLLTVALERTGKTGEAQFRMPLSIPLGSTVRLVGLQTTYGARMLSPAKQRVYFVF